MQVDLDFSKLYNFQQLLHLLKDIEIKYSSLVFILKSCQLLNIVCDSTTSTDIYEEGVVLILEVCQSNLKSLIETLGEKDTKKIIVHSICQMCNSSIKWVVFPFVYDIE